MVVKKEGADTEREGARQVKDYTCCCFRADEDDDEDDEEEDGG